MHITLNKQLNAPLYQQIKNQIIRLILSGSLSAGDVLPSERQLAEQLGINRSTVNKAYWELKSEGFIDAQMGSGTVVTSQFSRSAESSDAYVPPMPWAQIMTQPYQLSGNTIIKTALEAIGEPDTISFAGGFAGDDVIPIDLVRTLMPKCLDTYGSQLLHPTPLLGLSSLRSALCKQGMLKGIQAGIQQCMITSGAQQAISYLTSLFISPGDMIFTAAPSYVGAIEIFKAHGAKVVGVPADQFGMDTDILENYLIRYRPKLIYLNPNFQNPTGTYLPLERRKKLLDLAYLYQIPVIEDDPYSEIYFDSIDVPLLKAMDRHQYVIYIGTFSKLLFMGGRLGWIFGAEEVIQRLSFMKQVTDLHANTLHQYLVLEALQSGMLSKHLMQFRAQVKAKQDVMVDALNAYHIADMSFKVPDGGFYLWLKLPPRLNAHSFFEACKTLKVAVMPGDPFFPQATAEHTYVRINYTYPAISDIHEGVRRIAKAIEIATVATQHQKNETYTDLIL